MELPTDVHEPGVADQALREHGPAAAEDVDPHRPRRGPVKRLPPRERAIAPLAEVREHEPEVFSRARRFLLPKDYVRYRLTGAMCSDVSDASGTALLDVGRRQWSSEMLAALEIPPSFVATG